MTTTILAMMMMMMMMMMLMMLMMCVFSQVSLYMWRSISVCFVFLSLVPKKIFIWSSSNIVPDGDVFTLLEISKPKICISKIGVTCYSRENESIIETITPSHDLEIFGILSLTWVTSYCSPVVNNRSLKSLYIVVSTR
jgi:hypothetical protein